MWSRWEPVDKLYQIRTAEEGAGAQEEAEERPWKALALEEKFKEVEGSDLWSLLSFH